MTDEHSILFQQQPVYYKVAGSGRPVMLLHGFGEDGNVWHYQADFLKAQFKVIMPDLPGSGSSPVLKEADIDTYAEAIKLIIDAVLSESGDKKICLIGHSMGGYITLAVAEKYPELLSSFGLFHSSAFADTPEKKQTRLKAIGFVETNGVLAFFKTSTPALFTKEYNESNAGEVSDLIENSSRFTPEAIKQYYQAMINRPDRTEVLKEFRGPVLFIIGKHDAAIPLESSLQQCYLPSRSHVHILHQSAHMGMWEETGKSNQFLLNFLQDKP